MASSASSPPRQHWLAAWPGVMSLGMKSEPGIGRYRVGEWDFTPSTGELRRRADVRRLEPRAAQALELLCQADGAVVTHERLIERIWGGRSLSENSVAVVIGQLRRALDDDARGPRLIETLPKRGYRLLGGAAGDARGARRGGLLLLAAAAALLLAGVVAALVLAQAGPAQIAVDDVVNQTGDPKFDPLARATSELILDDLRERGFRVRRGGGDADLRLASKLVIWNNGPFLGITATDSRGVVRWSAMLDGAPDRLPSGVAEKLDQLKRTVASQ